MEHSVSEGVALKVVPTFSLELRRRFECCMLANPNGLSHCPKCGTAASPPSTHYVESIAITGVPIAAALFKAAEWMLNLAKRIERKRDDRLPRP